MKVMEIQYVTHCMDEGYQLITIHRAGDTLIHIVPSKTLRKNLLKQKDKMKSIKTGVICVKQSTPLTNGITYYRTSNKQRQNWENKKKTGQRSKERTSLGKYQDTGHRMKDTGQKTEKEDRIITNN